MKDEFTQAEKTELREMATARLSVAISNARDLKDPDAERAAGVVVAFYRGLLAKVAALPVASGAGADAEGARR